MGFTRSWKQPYGIAASAWEAIVEDAAKLVAAAGIPLVGGARDDDGDGNDLDDVPPGRPPFSRREIAFNGVGRDASEWFVLRPEPSPFQCVKTYEQPYDVLVAAALIVAKHHAPAEVLNVSSDESSNAGSEGAWGAWRPALELCAAADVAISERSVALLEADITHESEPYEPPKTPEERELDAAWARVFADELVQAFCAEHLSPRFLRYQRILRVTPRGMKLHLGRSIEARSLAPRSPEILRVTLDLQLAWNERHDLKIVEIAVS